VCKDKHIDPNSIFKNEIREIKGEERAEKGGERRER
jgi:hypothetical protein